MKFLKKINYLDTISVLFAVLFVYAGTSKLLTYDEFQTQIAQSPLISNHGWWISWSIPSIEIIIAALLFVPRFQLVAYYGAFFMMFAFTLYIGLMLAFTPDLPCSCGGILSSMGWKGHLVFNISFTVLAVIGILLLNKKRRTDMMQMA